MAEEPVKTTETTARSATPQSADRPASGPRGERRPPPRRPRYPRKRKFCKFCADTSIRIDHKNPDLLKQFITDRYKILPSRVTGTCAKHQRALTGAVKRARNLALIPFTPLHHD